MTESEHPAGLLLRWFARFVDALVLLVPTGLIVVAAALATRDVGLTSVLSLVGRGILVIAYDTVLVARRGSTVGKAMLGLQVRSLEGDMALPSWRQAGIRAVVTTLPTMISVPVVPIAWSLVDAVPAIADRELKRALHDRLAGTHVVKMAVFASDPWADPD